MCRQAQGRDLYVISSEKLLRIVDIAFVYGLLHCLFSAPTDRLGLLQADLSSVTAVISQECRIDAIHTLVAMAACLAIMKTGNIIMTARSLAHTVSARSVTLLVPTNTTCNMALSLIPCHSAGAANGMVNGWPATKIRVWSNFSNDHEYVWRQKTPYRKSLVCYRGGTYDYSHKPQNWRQNDQVKGDNAHIS